MSPTVFPRPSDQVSQAGSAVAMSYKTFVSNRKRQRTVWDGPRAALEDELALGWFMFPFQGKDLFVPML